MQEQGKITYHQQVTYCGKPRCRKCREGIGHGPYWYAYQVVNGQTSRTYIGKNHPSDVQAAMDVEPASTGESAMPGNPSLQPLSVDAPTLRAFTLGQFRLERCHPSQTNKTHSSERPAVRWQVVTEAVWQQRQNSQVRALLGYLLCHPQRRANRSQILADLWSTNDNEIATCKLNKTVRHLQRVLGSRQALPDAHKNEKQLLRLDDEWLILAGQEYIWCDADAFEEMIHVVPTIETKHVSDERARQRESILQEALVLYNGDFLPEEHESEWILPRRQALYHAWIAGVLELTDLYAGRNALSDAVKLLDRLLVKDPANEAAVQRLMVVLSHSTRRIEALRAYQRFETILRSEYHAEPSPKTLELREALRDGKELFVLGHSSGQVQYTPASMLYEPQPQKIPALPSNIPSAQSQGTSQRWAGHVLPDDEQAMLVTSTPAETIGRTHQSPFIGREQEMQVIRALLQEVERGVRLQLAHQRRASGIPLDTQRYPQCLLLMGDAGIGKTRLAEEMSREACHNGWTVVWSRLYPQESSIPYRLWIDALRKILDFSAHILPTVNVELLCPLATLLPEIAELLPHQLREQAPIFDASSLKEAICNLLRIISESTLLLIVLDDIQWADTDSQLLLGFLARLVFGYPIIFLGTCRDTEIPKDPSHPLRNMIAHMQRERAIKTLEVTPLTREQIGKLVQHVSQLPDTLVHNIQEKAAGNPYFAEELARSTPPVLPDTVKAALEHRIRRLSRDCQQLLKNAAVLGGTFEFSLICAMEASTGSSEESRDVADEDTVLTLLEEALRAGVLTEDEAGGARILYHFWHPLLVDSLYESVSSLRRARLHLRAADVLRNMHRGREEEVAATIANHLTKGGAEPLRIAHYSQIAGNRAYTIFAYQDAAHHYCQAFENLIKNVPQAPEQQERMIFLLEQMAECSSILGNYAEARDRYERVLALYRRRQQPAQSEAERLRTAQIQALLLIEIGLNWRYTGDKNHAWQCCAECAQILQVAGITTGHAWSRLHYLQSNVYRLDGRFDEALAAAQKALDLFERQQQDPAAAQPSATRLTTVASRGTHTISVANNRTLIQRTLDGNLINLGRIHRQIGTVAESRGQLTLALEHQSKALSVFERSDDKRQIAHVSCNLGYIHLKKAEYELARTALLRSYNLADRVGDTPLMALVISNLGELAASMGNLEEAEELYRDALARAESMVDRDREYVCRWSIGLGDVLQRSDKFAEAMRYLCRAWSMARDLRSQPCIGLTLVSMGELRIAQARTLGAESLIRQRHLIHARTHLQRTLILERLEMETHTRALLALARVALLQQEHLEANTLLAQARAEAQRYELTQIEKQACGLQRL